MSAAAKERHRGGGKDGLIFFPTLDQVLYGNNDLSESPHSHDIDQDAGIAVGLIVPYHLHKDSGHGQRQNVH